MHWFKKNQRNCTYRPHGSGAMTVPENAAALHELHTRLADVEELVSGSAERVSISPSCAMHDNMLNVLETAAATEGRMTEMDVGSAGTRQEAVEDFKKYGHTIVPASRGVHEGRGKALRLQSRDIWVQGAEANGQLLRPQHRCRRVLLHTRGVTSSASGLSSTMPRKLQHARSTM